MRLRTVGLVSALLLAGCRNVSLHVPLTDRDLSVTPQQAAFPAWVQQLCQQSVAFGMTGSQQQVCLSEAANHLGGGGELGETPSPEPGESSALNAVADAKSPQGIDVEAQGWGGGSSQGEAVAVWAAAGN
jgi:hypothetical protein